MARVRIDDVAKKAGVSKTTVSFVINETGSIAEATRQRVLDVVRDLGFSPSSMARGLRGRRTATVGMVVPDLFGSYFFNLFAGVEETMERKGYVCYLGNANEDAEREERYLRSLLGWHVDGLIFAPMVERGRPMWRPPIEEKLPLIFVDRDPEVLGLSSDAYRSVSTTNHDAALEGTLHLLARAGGPVALIAPDVPKGPVWLRRQGYREAVGRAGQPPVERVLPGDSREIGRVLVTQLVESESPPKGIFAATNPCGLGAYLALRERGLLRPGGVRLVVFDDADWADVAGVTVIRTDPYRIGVMAASALLQDLEGSGAAERRMTIPAQLVCRSSS